MVRRVFGDYLIFPSVLQKKEYNIMKKMLALLACFGWAGFAMADDAILTPIDVTPLKTALASWATTFGTLLLGIAGIFAAFWLLRLAIRLIKSISNTSK